MSGAPPPPPPKVKYVPKKANSVVAPSAAAAPSVEAPSAPFAAAAPSTVVTAPAALNRLEDVPSTNAASPRTELGALLKAKDPHGASATFGDIPMMTSGQFSPDEDDEAASPGFGQAEQRRGSGYDVALSAASAAAFAPPQPTSLREREHSHHQHRERSSSRRSPHQQSAAHPSRSHARGTPDAGPAAVFAGRLAEEQARALAELKRENRLLNERLAKFLHQAPDTTRSPQGLEDLPTGVLAARIRQLESALQIECASREETELQLEAHKALVGKLTQQLQVLTGQGRLR